MNNDASGIVAAIMAACIGAAGIGGCSIGRQWNKDVAIKKKVAEYYLDKDDNKQFRWIKPLPPCTHQQLPQRIYDDEEENGFRDVPNHEPAE